MNEKFYQHIGDDQLVYGLPKHMIGVPTSNSSEYPATGERYYWTVHPEPGACAACRAMAGLRYTEEPRRPHPNCKCEIRRHIMPVANLYGLLHGFEDIETRQFEAGQKITVTVRNIGPLLAGCRITVEQCEPHETGCLLPGKSHLAEFTKFGEIPLSWKVSFFYNCGDASTLEYIIQG